MSRRAALMVVRIEGGDLREVHSDAYTREMVRSARIVEQAWRSLPRDGGKVDIRQQAARAGIHPQGMDVVLRLARERLSPEALDVLNTRATETTAETARTGVVALHMANLPEGLHETWTLLVVRFMTFWRALDALGRTDEWTRFGESFDAEVQRLMRDEGLSSEEADRLVGSAPTKALRHQIDHMNASARRTAREAHHPAWTRTGPPRR